MHHCDTRHTARTATGQFQTITTMQRNALIAVSLGTSGVSETCLHNSLAVFLSLKHFGHFLLRHFGHLNMVSCLTAALKLDITAFFSLYFQAFWPKRPNFFRSFKNHFGLWLKMTKKIIWACYRGPGPQANTCTRVKSYAKKRPIVSHRLSANQHLNVTSVWCHSRVDTSLTFPAAEYKRTSTVFYGP